MNLLGGGRTGAALPLVHGPDAALLKLSVWLPVAANLGVNVRMFAC
jgi:hypothetical protein